MTDPSPSEILAAMVADAPDDAVGEWRVRVPTSRPPSFAEVVEVSRQALAKARSEQGQRRDAVAMANLLTAALVRHEIGACSCRASAALVQLDPICENADTLAREIASPS